MGTMSRVELESREFTFGSVWKIALAFGLFACMFTAILYLAYRQHHEDLVENLTLAAIVIALATWSVLWFSRYRVIVTAEALTVVNLWRTPRSIRWHEIAEVRISPYATRFVGRNGHAVSVSGSLPGLPEVIVIAGERALQTPKLNVF
jgi:hypothetical protein